MPSFVQLPRRSLLAGLAGLASLGAAPLGPVVTAEEVRRDRTAPRPPRDRSLPDPLSPRIEVDRPDATHSLVAPISFRVAFRPAPGAAIVASSFHAAYGFLQLDITSRLLERARLSAAELVAEQVDIPAGQHRVTLEIADNTGRIGRRTFRFAVV